MIHEDYIVFAGIRLNDVLVPFNILLPKEQALTNAQVMLDLNGNAPEKPKKTVPKLNTMSATSGRGRPRKTIPLYLAKILDEDISVREKAKLTGLSRMVVQRYVKEEKAKYTAT